MATAFIGFGGNLGDRAAACAEALARLGSTDGVGVVAVSDLFRSDPVGIVDQPWF
ncbi:MAG: 2-amino-4-hydroxy-6-hydroxymethyldihydropteridine diphosphokinase, partial [Deltaproteobacteria bacterium]|nr:2-amino-4-hydroxy-6-hydroxymethyldihydropteridine diphosphokinase [Deltaproteobacteria bacterium]